MISSGFKATSSGGRHSGTSCPEAEWSVVLPFKGGPNGKSRLQGHLGSGRLGPALRRELALGFLQDTVAAVAAASGVARIIIVSSDPSAFLPERKVTVLPDPGQGLNGAIKAGFALARSTSGTPVAALAADLPCLTALDLENALKAAKLHPLTVVPDRQGTGSTMISAHPGLDVHPRFGTHSYEAHLRAGHSPLAILRGSTLRADVDTLEDLVLAMRKGVGANTRAVLLSSGLTLPRHGPRGGHRQLPLTDTPTLQRKSCPVS